MAVTIVEIIKFLSLPLLVIFRLGGYIIYARDQSSFQYSGRGNPAWRKHITARAYIASCEAAPRIERMSRSIWNWTMGKEAQLLEAAAAGNNIRVEVSVVFVCYKVANTVFWLYLRYAL